MLVSSLPLSVCEAISGASAVGFSGSRSLENIESSVISEAVAAVPMSARVSVGCQKGVDELVRLACPRARVFSVSDFGNGRGAYAARSMACVRSVAVSGAIPEGIAGGLWVSFPSSACPAGLLPSSSSSKCFCGSGSGSWASLAYALGLGVRCVVCLPAGVSVPSGWGLSPVAAGWWVSHAAPVQLSLF